MRQRVRFRLLTGKTTNSDSGATADERITRLAHAILEQTFRDLTGKSKYWRADAERFFDDDHAEHRQWLCAAACLQEARLWQFYWRAKAGVLAAGAAPGRPGQGPDRDGAS